MRKEIEIAGRKIGEGHPAFIIAEMSANHNMDYGRAVEIIHQAKEAGADASVQADLLKEVSAKLAAAKEALVKLEKLEQEAAAMEDIKKQAFFYKDEVFAAMTELRAPVDELEMLVDKDVWPIPTYGDLIFEV